MTIGFSRRDAHGCVPRLDPRLEHCFPIFFGDVSAEPITRARELPRGLEIVRVLFQTIRPDLFGALRARERLAGAIERVGIVALKGRADDDCQGERDRGQIR